MMNWKATCSYELQKLNFLLFFFYFYLKTGILFISPWGDIHYLIQYAYTYSAYISTSELEAFSWLLTICHTLKYVLAVSVFLYLYVGYYPVFSVILKMSRVTKPTFVFLGLFSIWTIFVGRTVRGEYIYWNSQFFKDKLCKVWELFLKQYII